MIDADIGDDRDDGLNDVGGVQAAAQADLEDGKLHVLLGAEEQSHGGEQLEKARGVRQQGAADQFRGLLIHLSEEPAEVLVGDLGKCAVGRGAHALVHAQQVRRGVQARAQARRVQDRGQRRRG